MKNKTLLKLLFLSIVLSSCGLIERWKTPEQPVESNEVATTESSSNSADATDDLFSKTMEETDHSSGTDAPSNVATTDTDSELKSLEDEFSSSGADTTGTTTPVVSDAPVLVEEALPEIKTEVETPAYSEEGQIKSYKVQRGETLMQIAFKLYGDISKWKDIKSMNANVLTNNSSLKANTELKYRAPASPFVWNPTGTPYLIKTGETLGTISHSVYGTNKKWKAIWENNKPLIKNPNVIYAGFTLYYANGGMANYVQPKAAQPKKEIMATELAKVEAAREGIVEEVLVQDEMKAPKKAEPEVITANISSEDENQVDEAIQTLSAPERKEAAVKAAVERTINAPKEAEVDLINNVSVPFENQEIAPDIDEELQTLN